MLKRVCVFVDGENFRHTISTLFDGFPREEYLPKHADWSALFDWLVSEAVRGSAWDRVRAYWYVVEHIDFFPYKLPDPSQEPDKLIKLLSPNDALRDQVNLTPIDRRPELLENIVRRLSEERDRMKRRFEGWTTLQNGIAAKHRSVEFRRAGAITYRLTEHRFGTEKSVDVKLATDLIVLRDNYDLALIVSGDQDYVPAVQFVKDCGKSVVNVAFKTRGGKLLPGGAWRLNVLTDWTIEVTYAEFASRLKIATSRASIERPL